MENERKRLAQEFVDEVMSGKYPNIEIDENGYIDHYGIKYRLKVFEDGRILVFRKYTLMDWLSLFILCFILLFFLFWGRFLTASMDKGTIISLGVWPILVLLLLYPHAVMSTVQRNQFNRYINDKFKRSKKQNSD